MSGLSEEEIKTITETITGFPEVERAAIFGSRAKGSHIKFNTIREISYLLNQETLMPYRFDVLNYHTIKNPDLPEHIDRVGICFYGKTDRYGN